MFQRSSRTFPTGRERANRVVAFRESRQGRVCRGHFKAHVFDHPVNFAGGVSGRREIAISRGIIDCFFS